MKIYFLGDLHFSDNNEWSIPSIEKFIEWFHSLYIEPNSILIQLGDVFDRAANYGITIKLVTQFFRIASQKFEKIYVLGGNHDFVFRKNIYQYATNYLNESFENIHFIYRHIILEVNNKTIALFPFQKIPGKILDKYYSEELENVYYNCDIVCGHVGIEEKGTFFGGMNISKFKPDTKFILGHIHTRNGQYKNYYTGSILPFKINEDQTEEPRILNIYDIDTNTFSSINIPKIIKFEIANFGDTLHDLDKPDDGLIRLYTIKNCKHLHEAKSQYPNYYIYNIEKPNKIDNKISVSKQNLLMTPQEALSLMIKEQKIILKRKTLQVIQELLN